MRPAHPSPDPAARGPGAGLGLDAHEGIELTPVRVVETPEGTHIRYAVGGPAKLELDPSFAHGVVWLRY